MVVLSPRASVHAAARAMADNHIGSILVADRGKRVGIVTDRDLAVDVVARNLPYATGTHDVMSDEVGCVPITGSIEDVVRVMREHGCRRVPLMENGGKPVGLVTLDDLIIDGAIDMATARSIIVAQLEAGARFKEEGALHPGMPARPEMASRRGCVFFCLLTRADSA